MADRQPFNPKTTTFTNIALDEIMPRVSPNAWKVLCAALRKTQGWADPASPTGRKQSDVIAQSQFMEATGIASRHTVMTAIQECLDAKYLVRVPDGQSFRYSLDLSYEILDTCAEIAQVEQEDLRENRAGTCAEIAQVEAKTCAEIAHTNSNTNHKINHKREGEAQNASPARPLDHDPILPHQRKRDHLDPGPEPSTAVKVYLQVCNDFAKPQTAMSPTRRAIDAIVRESTVREWESICKDWLLSGYRPENIRGLLDAFKNGGLHGRADKSSRGSTNDVIKSGSQYTADA